MLELESQQSILSIVHSKTYGFKDVRKNMDFFGELEVCLLDSDNLKEKH